MSKKTAHLREIIAKKFCLLVFFQIFLLNCSAKAAHINFLPMVSEYYMRRCLNLAEKGFGHVAPNPMVGAVIVCNDQIIGEGYHQQFGGPHAEVNAIASVQDESLLPNSTLYVSLEPCCHYGKTPPCADLIIEKRIPHVVVCNRDPFPSVNGKGIEKLIMAGVKVEVGLLASEGKWLNRRFFTFHEKKRPYILLKWAQSADGFMDKIRMKADEDPLRISSPDSIAAMHRFRAGESAIMVGPNTAIMDNPSLTVRYAPGNQPLRILLDRDLNVPASAHLLDGSVPTLVITSKEDIPHRPNVCYVYCDFLGDGSLNLNAFYELLYRHNVESIIIEGGRLLLQSFLDKGQWDELRVETNRSLFVRHGVKAPDFKLKENPEIQRFQIQEFGPNEVSFYRKSEQGFGSCTSK